MRLIASCVLLFIAFSGFAQETKARYEHYHKVASLSGSLTTVGSDTLAGITTLWVEAFKHLYPSVNGEVQASGSSTAPPALTEGQRSSDL